MASRDTKEGGTTERPRLFEVLFRWLASLQVAMVLIVLLAIVLAVATFLESAGREVAQWRVYHSQWFMALLVVVALNVLAATLIRFPWGWRRFGFLVTHAGILVLLVGAMQTFQSGVDGQISLVEGETADRIMVTDREEFVVAWEGQKGFHGEGPVHYLFHAGPVDWPEGKSLDFGRLGGMGLKVLKFYRHAQVAEQWVADEEGQGGPALEFGLVGKDRQTVQREWLAPDEIGDEQSVGPARFRLLRATVDSMADDFLHPPAADMDKEGVLSLHYEGRMYRIPVGANLGKKVPVGKTKAFLEIVGYFPNGTPIGSGDFVSQGNEPQNPVVTLRVYLPGKNQPLRQVAFAAKPLLSSKASTAESCPIKFWYHHPKVAVVSGVEFLQTPNRKLYCRIARNSTYQPGATVATGNEIEMGAQFKVSVFQYLPKARREVTCQSLEPAAGMARAAGPAALVQVTAGETTRQLWLKENDSNYGLQSLSTPEGRLEIRFANEDIPLGFVLKLKEFQRGRNPGGMGDASFSSTVQLLDHNGRKLGEDQQISMNEPLTRGKYTLYQSGFNQASSGKNISVFSVAYDPGQLLKYTGGIMVCAGSVLMFLTRALKRSPRADRSANEAADLAASNNGDGRASRRREEEHVEPLANL